MSSTEFAPAKVNLFLHVGAAGPAGRHPICSLVVFADIGDVLKATSTAAHELIVEGPFADQIGPLEDNMVTRALAMARSPPMRVELRKLLPAAAGLGGGTSDAGAALRLAGRLFPALAAEQIESAARQLGADGMMCLRACPALAEGEGEQLTAAPLLPELATVLVNPGVPSPTGAVYRAYDTGNGPFKADRPNLPDKFISTPQLAEFLKLQRNDLEDMAITRTPEIGAALAALRASPMCLLARMSGSGSTVFGLFSRADDARAAAATIRSECPGWWVLACTLNAASRGTLSG
ncbi:MAG: 4-(cytidine 5'-diphospho)-2-C-methyl-D-erythritol kinase [Caulobacterales bacterium]|nr:4-(cytidine 5'-diphospho)-2-C-methyl-D-erythritol kinase [Caulobacterales bacterium]